MADLEQVYLAAEDRLAASLRGIRAAFEHAATKGGAVEEAVSDFLRSQLPGNLAIGTGIIIDSFGGQSRQVDIVIYDRAKTPTFFSSGGALLIPIECVYFVFEVKTSLTSEAFQRSVENMKSIKSLRRAAYVGGMSGLVETQQVFPGRERPYWETVYGVIALDSNSSELSILKWFEAHQSNSQGRHALIDTMFVLGRGLYTNRTLVPPSGVSYSFVPQPDSLSVLVKDRPLFLFMGLFSVFYNQARMLRPLDFTKYIHSVSKTPVIGCDTERSKQVLNERASGGYVFAQNVESGGENRS